MFEELLISVLFIIVLIILCIISNLYSKKEEKNIMLRNSIKEDLKENFISEEECWQYNKEYSDKIKKQKKIYNYMRRKKKQ